MKQKNITYWLSVIVVGITLGLALQFVRAWTEPTAAPPNGNIGAPINTGAQSQTKTGGITASTLTAVSVKGTTQLCIGTDCRTTWPSGGTPGSTGVYQCPVAGIQSDWMFGSDCPLDRCRGQVSGSPTCTDYEPYGSMVQPPCFGCCYAVGTVGCARQ